MSASLIFFATLLHYFRTTHIAVLELGRLGRYAHGTGGTGSIPAVRASNSSRFAMIRTNSAIWRETGHLRASGRRCGTACSKVLFRGIIPTGGVACSAWGSIDDCSAVLNRSHANSLVAKIKQGV